MTGPERARAALTNPTPTPRSVDTPDGPPPGTPAHQRAIARQNAADQHARHALAECRQTLGRPQPEPTGETP